jgi:hypothetical protein
MKSIHFDIIDCGENGDLQIVSKRQNRSGEIAVIEAGKV